MAARYGVSRGTVRQAVITLQLEGLLDTRQGARRTVQTMAITLDNDVTASSLTRKSAATATG
jgi:DNA-binding FadR family transcriptional regulator